MSAQTKKIQGKIFRGEGGGGGLASSRSSSDPALTISIPKPAEHSAPQARPQLTKSQPAQSPKQDGDGAEYIPFRERLSAKLRTDYDGVERYRLDQANKKEKHWKRWGPYLSDRQWVRPYVSSRGCFLNSIYLGYCA